MKFAGLSLVLFCLVGCDNAVNSIVEAAVDIDVKTDSLAVTQEFESAIAMQAPASHKGGVSITIRSFGQGFNFVSLIPRSVQANEIFEGGSSIKYNPGPHTIVVGFVAQGRNSGEQLTRSLLSDLASKPEMKKVFLQANGKKVAAYEEVVTSFGQENLTYQIALDDGKTLVLTGPKEGFDHDFKFEFVSALVAAHPANEQLYAHVQHPEINPNAQCGLGELPDEFEVQMVHVRRGAQELTGQAIDPRETEAYLQTVRVGKTEKPLVLVLMAGEPTVWQISQTSSSNLAGVLATGRHAQKVLGLPKETRRVQTDRNSGCKSFYVEQRELEQGKYPKQIWDTFASDPQQIHVTDNGSGFEIGVIDTPLTSDPALQLEDVLLDPTKQLLPGKLGIAQLHKKGVLRRASTKDFEAWLLNASSLSDEKANRQREDVARELQRERVFMIVQETELPKGMGGANSMRFIAATGIDGILGDLSHNTIYFADGRCKGPACPR